MKQIGLYEHPDRPPLRRRFWAIALMGLPITIGLLLATHSGLREQMEQWSNQWFSHLDAPYRYPFPDSLPRSNPTARIEQEIGFYQTQSRQNAASALDRAALASAYLRMARATGQGNWYLLADEAARQSLANLPQNSEALAVLARVAEAQHDFAGALRLADQVDNAKEAIALRATSNLALGKLPEANRAANQLVDLTLSMNAFTLQALVRTAQGQDQAALQSFQNALDVEEPGDLSNSARTRTLLGRFYYERGQLEFAEQLYREALHILPGYAMALMNLAQLDIRQGRYQSAENHYAQIVEMAGGAPTIYDPLMLRGRARSKALEGDRPAAEALWAEAETLLRQSFNGNSAGSFGHRRDLARLLLERGRSADIAEAVTLMQTEVRLRRDAETLDTYAWALARADRWQEARQVIQEAIAPGVRNAGMVYRAGTIEQALGNASQAQRYFQQAQAIDPNFGDPPLGDRARQAQGLSAGLGS